jgi:hypothetical protein
MFSIACQSVFLAFVHSRFARISELYLAEWLYFSSCAFSLFL